jgi:tetratricopeptide (TPR) repeat protein
MSSIAPERRRLLAAARREVVDGLLVLHLAGAPYAMGVQHGALCRDEIHNLRRAAYHYLSGEVARLLRLPRAAARLITRPLLLWQARAYLPFVAPEHREEMRGIADGAGVHLLEAVLINAIWELYLASGCSEFALRGRKSAGGALIHGYNYDLLEPGQAFISPYLALLFYRPDSGAPFAQLNMLGCVGVNAGISARGISVAWDNTVLRPGSALLAGVPRHCTPFVLALRQLIQQADSIESAVAIMRDHLPRPTADIIIVGDGRAERAVAIETAGGALAVREMDDDAVWSANSFVTPALAAEDRPAGGGVGETGNSQGRYTSYAELLGRPGAHLDLAGAVELLRDPYPRERCGYRQPPERTRTICRPMTAFSLVMQPGLQQFWVGDLRIPAPLGRYIGFDLASEAPLPGATVPPSGFQHAAEGYRHFAAGRHQEAARALERALELDGESAPLHLMLAQVYRALGQAEAAQAEEQRAQAAGALAGERIPFPSAIQPLTYLTLKLRMKNEE